MRCSKALDCKKVEVEEEKGMEMDTPERSKVAGATPLSKFEDSPLFNFIDNLSPIQPVRSVDSVHIAHTYQTLNFASLTSIFSSPHANLQRESKFLVRAPFSDFSKQDTFCNNVDENNPSTTASTYVRQSKNTVVAKDNCARATLADNAPANSTDACSALPDSVMPLSQYDAGSPNHNIVLSYKMKENHPHVQNRNKELSCDWENLIGDGAEGLLIFDSPIETDAHVGSREITVGKNVDTHCSLESKAMENADKPHDLKSDTLNVCGVSNASDKPLSNGSEDIIKKNGTDHSSAIVSGNCDYQVDNLQQRGIRRRCLVFEGAGLSRKNICQDPNHNPLNAGPSKGKNLCGNNSKPEIIVPRVLPGIGLHLNTLSTSSRERIASKETVATGQSVINMQSCFSPLLPPKTGQMSLNKPVSVKKDVQNNDREVEDSQAIHDETSQNNAPEQSQGTSKKKRSKLDNGSDSEGCKHCNCKKSKCLKLYCECFAAGVYCSEPCSCQGCFNKPIHEETVLGTRKQIESRNPLAFAPKVIHTSETGQEIGEVDNKTPASARHKRGCNCKKSSCLKKYCECYQGGVGCSLSCRCEGCKNAFGRKDGILPIAEIELVDDGVDALEKEMESQDDDQQNASVQIDDQLSESILPITPFDNCRLSIDLPYFSNAKPPRSTKLSAGPSPGLYGPHVREKSDILLSQHEFENNLNTIHEDDTPTILRATASPISAVKTVSPNSKRVSPPHNMIGPSPACKGGRKLILKSIPSFPSLSNDVSTHCPMSCPDSSLSSSAFN